MSPRTPPTGSPATYAAVRSALGALRDRAGGWAPGTHLDLGGGTGAATWAVADAWPDGGHASTVLDWSQAALTLGGALAGSADAPAVREARWTRTPLGGAPALPASDLVTLSYVIGELTAADRASLVDAAAEATLGALVIAEPGTPDGYARIIEARDRLIAAGLTVLAPCPHDAACPVGAGDWCHFAARVQRSFAAPPDQGRHPAVRGREVQLRGGRAPGRRARAAGREPGRTAPADPQGPGAARSVHP